MKTILRGNLITPMRVVEHGEIEFENGVITYAGVRRRLNDGVASDFGDNNISPGFIDLHVHGGGGGDFMDADEDTYLKIAETHQDHGTTTMLSTTLTSSDEELFNVFDIYKRMAKKRENTCLYGLHLEGPYFSDAQKGAQDPRYICSPKPEHYLKILEKGGDMIKRWSVAPELDGAMELGRILYDRGILAAIGHSNAEYETALEACENGYTLLTHFYSGMSTIVRKSGFRHPGLIESGYMIDALNIEIIADGCHLPASLLRLIYTTFGANRVAVITDALRGAGTDADKMIIGSLKDGYEVDIEDGVGKLPDRSGFAGSIATTDRLVRNMKNLAGAPIADAVRMATMTPARIAGIKNKGVLRVGYDADICVFDESINVCRTYINGNKVFEK